MYNIFRKTNVLGRCVFNGDATQGEQTTSTNLYTNCYIRIRRYILFLVTPIILFSLISCTLDVASTDDESPTSPPSSSSSVTATGLSSNSVSISWDSVSGATYYQVYNSIGLLVATVFLPVTNYIVSGLLPNTEYIYHVRGCNLSGCTDLTSVSVTTETPPIINGTAEVPPVSNVTAEVPPVIDVTAEVPTIISNAAELAAIGTNSSTLSGDYILTGNIDLSTISNWRPIGNRYYKFTGSFDGNGYSISGLSSSGYEYAGLFGYVSDAYISNIGVIVVNISSSYSTGGLVGYADNSQIRNSYASVEGDISSSLFRPLSSAGGLIGTAARSWISNSYALVEGDISSAKYAGGLIGGAYESPISNSYALVEGDIFTDVSHTSYSWASHQYNSAAYAGGLVGWARESLISHSYYSTSREYFSNSFGISQTVDELRALTAVSTGWGVDVWNFGTDADLPRLRSLYYVINIDAEVSPVINVTAEVPTIISNAAELAAIGTNSSTLSGDYILTGNIDLSTISNWRPIGDNPSNGFTGSFDGNGYSISGLSSSGYEYAGLFGYVKDAYISNIGVIAGNISSSNTFASSAGGLVGYAYYSDISNSYAVVMDDISAYDGGGLVGYAYYSDISNSYAMVADDISAYDNYGSSAGGLVGKFNDSKISNSYAVVAGDISASDDYGSLAGGLIGYFVYSFISVDYVNKGAPVSNSYYSASREYSQGSFSNSFGTYQTVDELRALTAVSTGWDGAIWNFGTDADLPMLVATPLTVPLPSIFHE